jgi:NitT/TauT family transport system substrate-binding protein
MTVRLTPVLASLTLVAALGACDQGGSTSSSPPASVDQSIPGATGESTALTIGLGYIPSVQFAQFYLADQNGYYRDAGLEVTFRNQIDPDLITLVGQGAVDAGLGDGTSVIPAVSQGIPVRYAATIYADFPSIVFAKQSSGIESVEDLRGQRLGTPGRFGSGWIMLQALLASEGMTPDDLEIVDYPDFGQLAALQQDAVDAATGFANNEPVQLELSGEPATVLRVDEITPLPGPGIVVGAETLEEKRDALRAFVAATLRAMEEIIADPEVGLDAAVARVPELGEDRERQLAILEATVEAWHSPYTEANGLGAIDRDAWAESIEFMRGLPDSPVPNLVEVDQVVTEELLGE